MHPIALVIGLGGLLFAAIAFFTRNKKQEAIEICGVQPSNAQFSAMEGIANAPPKGLEAFVSPLIQGFQTGVAGSQAGGSGAAIGAGVGVLSGMLGNAIQIAKTSPKAIFNGIPWRMLGLPYRPDLVAWSDTEIRFFIPGPDLVNPCMVQIPIERIQDLFLQPLDEVRASGLICWRPNDMRSPFDELLYQITTDDTGKSWLERYEDIHFKEQGEYYDQVANKTFKWHDLWRMHSRWILSDYDVVRAFHAARRMCYFAARTSFLPGAFEANGTNLPVIAIYTSQWQLFIDGGLADFAKANGASFADLVKPVTQLFGGGPTNQDKAKALVGFMRGISREVDGQVRPEIGYSRTWKRKKDLGSEWHKFVEAIEEGGPSFDSAIKKVDWPGGKRWAWAAPGAWCNLAKADRPPKASVWNPQPKTETFTGSTEVGGKFVLTGASLRSQGILNTIGTLGDTPAKQVVEAEQGALFECWFLPLGVSKDKTRIPYISNLMTFQDFFGVNHNEVLNALVRGDIAYHPKQSDDIKKRWVHAFAGNNEILKDFLNHRGIRDYPTIGVPDRMSALLVALGVS